MSPRTGRPPSEDPRTEINRIRLTKDEQEAIAEAARLARMDVATWSRRKLLAAAKRAKNAQKDQA